MEKLTIFYDGACPLCRREIALMQRFNKRERLVFEDVSDISAPISCPIDRKTLLARFHARLPNGAMTSGARAFTEAYAALTGFGFIAYFGRWRWSRTLLDGGYAIFLKIRPRLQRWLKG